MMDLAKLKELVSRHEGVRYSVYIDTEGCKTIGIGFNLDDRTAKPVCEDFGINYDLLLKGARLTVNQVHRLFDYSIDSAFQMAHMACPEFDDLCENAQLALTDMTFNMGYTRLLGFKLMLAALARQDYTTAAKEMAESVWAGQTGNRAKDDIALMQSCI